MSEPRTIDLEIPEQGISQHLSRPDAIAFMKAESAWYGKYQQMLTENVVLENRNHGDPLIYRGAIGQLNQVISSLGSGDDAPLHAYVKSCREFRCFVGQGYIGKKIDEFFEQGDAQAARWLALIFSGEWLQNAELVRALGPFRATMLGSPAFKGAIDLAAAANARDVAESAQQTSTAAALETSSFIAEKTA
jgi:hypothetical protein